MRTLAFSTKFVFCLLFFIFPFISRAASETANRKPPENLFIVILDAVRYKDTLGNKHCLYTENICTKLKPEGAALTKFYNKGQTFSLPSYASLLTGTRQVYKNPEGPALSEGIPTIFEYYIKKTGVPQNKCLFVSSNPEYKMLSFSASPSFGKDYAPVFIEGDENAENENAVYDKAVPYIEQNHPSLVVLSLTSGKPISRHTRADECLTSRAGSVDACGGAEALNAYYESIITMDNIVFDLWNRIDSDPAYKDNTVFVVVSAHGRHENDYSCWGDDCRGCTLLTLVMAGPGIKKGFVSSKKRELTDLCPTLGHIMGVPTPFSTGKIMKELFE